MPVDTSELERRLELGARAAREFSEAVRQKFANRVRGIRLYGSFARGDAMPESDVDVLVLLDRADWQERDQISALAFRIGALKYEIPISPAVFSVEDFQEMLYRERSLALAIQREGKDL